MKAVLIDLDGVIYDSQGAIKGANKTISWLNEHQVPYLFVTNTTSIPGLAIVEKLSLLGIDVEIDKILTPLVVARQWLNDHQVKRISLFLPDKSKTEFNEFNIIDASKTQACDAVLVGDFGESWNHDTLNQAFRLLKSPSKPILMALGMSRYWYSKQGLSLDVGPFIKALEFASDCNTVIMGKPSGSFFETAVNRLGRVANETIMIGDDIRSDIEAAQQCGLNTVLVRTGKFSNDDLDLGITPDAIIDSIADLVPYLQCVCAKQAD